MTGRHRRAAAGDAADPAGAASTVERVPVEDAARAHSRRAARGEAVADDERGYWSDERQEELVHRSPADRGHAVG